MFALLPAHRLPSHCLSRKHMLRTQHRRRMAALCNGLSTG
jgi:hypothetical protein